MAKIKWTKGQKYDVQNTNPNTNQG
jgi:hypothetical protein